MGTAPESNCPMYYYYYIWPFVCLCMRGSPSNGCAYTIFIIIILFGAIRTLRSAIPFRTEAFAQGGWRFHNARLATVYVDIIDKISAASVCRDVTSLLLSLDSTLPPPLLCGVSECFFLTEAYCRPCPMRQSYSTHIAIHHR